MRFKIPPKIKTSTEPKKRFYITTTIPYVNADPHIGFALELTQADLIARYQQLQGDEIEFNTGTDEHGAKIYKSALEVGKDPKKYVDEYSIRFENLCKVLNISNTRFIRTTDPHHEQAAQEFWNRCLDAGYIYKAAYKIKYCTGCELEKTDSELEDGKCPLHPNLSIEEREEENYFFKFSKFQKPLLKFYQENPSFVLPDFRFKEVRKFVEGGLRDFSISRLKEKMPWGVPVPGDETQVMYVWFDALVNYISTLGWPEEEKTFSEFWPGTQVAGKDNLRQQSAIWQAMLMAAGLPNSKQILIHGFVTVNGQKMSKSLGNVVDPFKLVEKYGVDVVRYYLLREIPSDEDGDFSEKKLIERYNGDLANGLGNFASRVSTLGETFQGLKKAPVDHEVSVAVERARQEFREKIAEFRFHDALAETWKLIEFGDLYINNNKPWDEKDGDKKNKTIYNLVVILDNVASLILPVMPESAAKITGSINWISGESLTVKKIENLFPRLS